VQTATIGLGNLKVKVPIDRSQRNKNQTIDSSREKYLSGLHNNNSGLKMKLV